MAVGQREFREEMRQVEKILEEQRAAEKEALIATCDIDETKGQLYYNHNATNFARVLEVALSHHKGVRRIVFGPTFNQPITIGDIPGNKGIDTLDFGAAFNQKIKDLPFSVTTLSFGRAFNKPLQTLPITIQHICLLNMNPSNLTEKSFENIPKGVVVCTPLHYFWNSLSDTKQKHDKKCHHYQPRVQKVV